MVSRSQLCRETVEKMNRSRGRTRVMARNETWDCSIDGDITCRYIHDPSQVCGVGTPLSEILSSLAVESIDQTGRDGMWWEFPL